MKRKQFLLIAWKKAIKPLLLVWVLYLSVKFLVNAIAENSIERFTITLLVGLTLLLLVGHLVSTIFRMWAARAYSKLPERAKFWLKIIARMFNFLATMAVGIIVYLFWQKDWKVAALVTLLLLAGILWELVKEEKRGLIGGKRR